MEKIQATGTQVTTGGVSALATIPTDTTGTRARWVRLMALGNCYVKPTDASGSATVNDILLSPNEALVLDMQGFSRIAHIQNAAAEKFNITPLDGPPTGEDMLKIQATGTQVTTGASATTAIPSDTNGVRARWVRLQALANCYVRPGFVGTTCLVGDALLSPNESLILDVQGFTHIASLQESGNAAKFNITPLDGPPWSC